MHEAALAGTLAIRLRQARATALIGRPRLLVRGGHDEPDDFDAALRLHLALAAPEMESSTLEILHLPVERICSGCGGRFSSDRFAAACPACGSPALPNRTLESVELEWIDGPAV
jgi:hypothetical protein